jgi:putative peptidoglycan lipid II flippase
MGLSQIPGSGSPNPGPAPGSFAESARARPSMLRSVASFSSMTMISRVFGLLRDMVISSVFGANAATDAFWVAFRIPNFMRRLFAEGSFTTAFVPVFTQIKETRSHADLKELVAHTAGALGGVLLVIVGLAMIFTPQVATVFSPGAIHDPQKFKLTVDLLRLTFPFVLFISLTALAGGALNSFNRFGMPALAPVILNLCVISSALWLSPHLRTPILALGWAILAGGILQTLFLLPQLAQLDLLSMPRWGFANPDVRKVMRLMVPTLFGSSIMQVNLLLDTIIASLLFVGSQSWVSQADRFLELPLGVFGIAFGTVMLPTLSRYHVTTDREGFSRTLDWGLRSTLMIAMPAMLALMLICVPLVATLYQHGNFTPFDTRMAALSVFGLSIGLPAFAMVKVVVPAFYARQDTRTPVKAGLVAMVANMVFNVLIVAILYRIWAPAALQQGSTWVGLSKVPGLHFALGLASAIASYLNLALLWHWLKRAKVYQPQPGWGRFLLRLLTACTAMVVALLLCLHLGPDFTRAAVLPRIAWLGALVVGGGGVYGLTMLALGFRMRELHAH